MVNITNLTNSTWEFIDGLNPNETIVINVNFVSNDFEYDRISFERGTGLIYIKNSNPTVVYPMTDGTGVWVNEESKTITITGGEDVENVEAINNLKEMAVYISGGMVEPEPDEPDTPTEGDKYETIDEFFTAVGDAIRTKKGTTGPIKKQNIPSEILSIEIGAQEISTEQEMNALLIADNVGKVYRFVGVTGTYVNGDLYEVVSE
jgi:hypothetical protein